MPSHAHDPHFREPILTYVEEERLAHLEEKLDFLLSGSVYMRLYQDPLAEVLTRAQDEPSFPPRECT